MSDERYVELTLHDQRGDDSVKMEMSLMECLL
jgi:hypothetical protein